MHWHIDSDFVSLLAACLLTLYHRRMHPDSREKLRSRRFTACLWVCVVATVADILASIAMDMPTSRIVYHLLMTLYFVCVVLVILSWFGFSMSILYDDDPKRGRTVVIAAIVPYLLYVALALSNPWTGLFYTLDANMVYARGPLFFLMVAVFGGYTVWLFLTVLIRRRHIAKRYSSRVLLLIPLLLAVSIVVQLCHNGWLTILPMYCICLLLAFFFLQSEEIAEQSSLVEHLSIEASTDKLTGVLNRAGAEARVNETLAEGLHEQCLVVFVDVDNLKIFNDQLGHECGDKALVAVADRLRGFFRASDVVARYGGDEFIACLFGSFGEEQVLRWLERLHGQLSGVPVDEGGALTVNASIGASWGDAHRSIETLLHQADSALYGVKRGGKNGYALYRPPEQTAD